jgi:hypothetical protein
MKPKTDTDRIIFVLTMTKYIFIYEKNKMERIISGLYIDKEGEENGKLCEFLFL